MPDLVARPQGPADRSGRGARARRSPRRSLRRSGDADRRAARAASSSPAWASPASSAARSRRRSPAPARRRSSCTPPKPCTAISASSRRDDVVIAMSYSGETEELTRVLETLKRIGAPLIALTGGPTSTLAQAANVALDCSVSEEACPMNLVPTASTTAALAHGRCAGHDRARREGLQARGLRQPSSGRQARQAPDARRAVDAAPAMRCRSCSCTRRCAT